MLSCRDMTELATAYTEGALPWRDRWAFRLHLMMCEHCRRYLAQLRATVAALGGLTRQPPDPGAEAEDAALKAFRGWRQPPG